MYDLVTLSDMFSEFQINWILYSLLADGMGTTSEDVPVWSISVEAWRMSIQEATRYQGEILDKERS
jgi:hypothetical protein